MTSPAPTTAACPRVRDHGSSWGLCWLCGATHSSGQVLDPGQVPAEIAAAWRLGLTDAVEELVAAHREDYQPLAYRMWWRADLQLPAGQPQRMTRK